MNTAKTRYRALDAIRGFCLLLMMAHHLGVDLVMFGLAPEGLLENPVLYVLQPLFAACFVALSGASSRFSRSSLSRGGKLLLCAGLVTLATWGMGRLTGDSRTTVVFGILHFLGVASLLYPLAAPLLDRLRVPGPVWLALFMAARLVLPHQADVPVWLAPLGIYPAGFHSADYYPLLPWIFAYFFGVWVADVVRGNRLPQSFYDFSCPVLEWVSRHSLWIYLLHQPIFIALLQACLALR